MIQTAIRAARAAGTIQRKHFGKPINIHTKKGDSYFTNVDLSCEKVIFRILQKKFPDYNIISEEAGSLKKKSDYTWYIDPLDGTHNYIKALPFFGVSIALVYKNSITLGVIYLPFFRELYVAEKGKQSTCNGKRITVAKTVNLKKAFVVTDLMLRYYPEKKLRLLKRFQGNIYDVRGLGCAVYGYSAVAKGSADAYVTTFTYPWDVAAGSLIIEGAGGKVTDHAGNPWSPHARAFVSSNGKLHSKLLALVR